MRTAIKDKRIMEFDYQESKKQETYKYKEIKFSKKALTSINRTPQTIH